MTTTTDADKIALRECFAGLDFPTRGVPTLCDPSRVCNSDDSESSNASLNRAGGTSVLETSNAVRLSRAGRRARWARHQLGWSRLASMLDAMDGTAIAGVTPVAMLGPVDAGVTPVAMLGAVDVVDATEIDSDPLVSRYGPSDQTAGVTPVAMLGSQSLISFSMSPPRSVFTPPISPTLLPPRSVFPISFDADCYQSREVPPPTDEAGRAETGVGLDAERSFTTQMDQHHMKVQADFRQARHDFGQRDEFGRSPAQQDWTVHYKKVMEYDENGDLIPDGVFDDDSDDGDCHFSEFDCEDGMEVLEASDLVDSAVLTTSPTSAIPEMTGAHVLFRDRHSGLGLPEYVQPPIQDQELREQTKHEPIV